MSLHEVEFKRDHKNGYDIGDSPARLSAPEIISEGALFVQKSLYPIDAFDEGKDLQRQHTTDGNVMPYSGELGIHRPY